MKKLLLSIAFAGVCVSAQADNVSSSDLHLIGAPPPSFQAGPAPNASAAQPAPVYRTMKAAAAAGIKPFAAPAAQPAPQPLAAPPKKASRTAWLWKVLFGFGLLGALYVWIRRNRRQG